MSHSYIYYLSNIVAFQNLCSLFLLEALRGSSLVSYKRKLDSKQLQLVLPLSLSFVGMLLSGYMCLKVYMFVFFLSQYLNMLITIQNLFFF